MMNLRRSQMMPEKKGKQIIHIINYMGIGRLPVVSMNEAHTEPVPVTSRLTVYFYYTTSSGSFSPNGTAIFQVGSTSAGMISPTVGINRKQNAYKLEPAEDEHSIYVLINES